MKVDAKCPNCGAINNVEVRVRLSDYQHKLVTCDTGDGEKDCGTVFVIIPKFSVKVEVSQLKKAKG